MTMNETGWINSLLASRQCQPVSREVEKVLFARFRAGDARAGDRLVSANLKFVRGVAINYTNHGLTLGELMNEGAIGLKLAVYKFNPSENFRFISYAVWWIRQRILKAMAEQTRSFRMPTRFMEFSRQMQKARQKLEQEIGRMPTRGEIAAAMGIKLKTLEDSMGTLDDSESLNAPLDDRSYSGMDILIGPEDTEAIASDESNRRNIQKLIAYLDQADQKVVNLYFGFVDDQPNTLEEIGDAMDVSKERVRQRKEKALPKLKAHAKRMGLG